MIAVLGTVVYHGFLITTRFEIAQKLRQLGCSNDWAENVEISHRSYGNAAPLYEAAVRLQEVDKRTAGREVTLEWYRQQLDSARRQLQGQQLALQLLRRAAQEKRCQFSLSELRGEFNFLGYRSLVRAGCLEMMRLAELGEFSAANQVAQDLIRMIVRLEEAPTAIHHSIGLSLTQQLSTSIRELQAAYPGQGFQQLAPQLDELSRALEAGFARCPAFEREAMAARFQQFWETDGGMVSGSHIALDLQVARAELAYLETSQEVEAAFQAGDETRVMDATLKLGREDKLAAAMTPCWPSLAKKHREVISELKPGM